MDILSILKIRDFFNFKDWLEDRKYGKRDDLRNLAIRVIKVLNAHDIPVSRIPWIFPELNFHVKDFKDLDSIVSIISDEFLDNLSSKFFIQRSWLDRGEGSPQVQYEHGYDFVNVFNLLTNLKLESNEFVIVYFIAENGTKFVPAKDHDTNHGIIIVIAFSNDNEPKDRFSYTRYLPLYVGYWNYYKTRMMIKSISLLCFQLNLFQNGYFSKLANYEGLKRHFVKEILNEATNVLWHPDDYIFSSVKSGRRMDANDAESMHDYLKAIGYYEKILNLSECEWLD